ncbi:class I SAM-dependent methyltransferase [Streptomyces sp. P9(2023)]|uniref:class I SAM-dependent methyltransferase n=1 Tax=Streptomyces sp. P9(2023) TaxID=3064394 RepID=UPI0028F40224|nr:class I SAM-dependent methyltransferase [Streptomyces sp. P9(2023)]MDT9690278.1 class I SAM-dependent methyltransferase [Streptomyces sp. P9(2023)]
MTAAAEHYEHLLAANYTWMLGGDIESVSSAQTGLLRELGVAPRPGGAAAAVDLGCGPGPQTLALVGLGFDRVTAVDTSAALLGELAEHAARGGLTEAVRTVESDIRGCLPRLTEPGSVSAVVCMGDTLPHLSSREDVRTLIADAAGALGEGGSLVVTFRDLTRELSGAGRFIPVRGTDDRILTCFLEYVDEDTVLVHDLLHTRRDGEWHLTAGSYPKLRLASSWVADQCRAAGLVIRHDQTGPRGMHVLHAVKP